ncbi:MAG: hypothetical protein ACR2QG_03255 [Gammaproteobacteria bacterium]
MNIVLYARPIFQGIPVLFTAVLFAGQVYAQDSDERADKSSREQGAAEGQVVDEAPKTVGEALEEKRSQVAAEKEELEEPEAAEAIGQAQDTEEAAKPNADELAIKLDERSVENEARARSDRKGEVYYEAETVAKAQPVTSADKTQNDVDVLDIDVSNSTDDAVAKEGYFQYGGDLRVAYNWEDQQFRDGSSSRDDNFTGRLRFGSQFSTSDRFRIKGRLAYRCATTSCSPEVDLAGDDENGSIEPGTLTADEFFIQWFRSDKASLAVGRMQTRNVSRGGVFARSLDRNNSRGTTVSYTDGMQLTLNPGRGAGWRVNFITEWNDNDGATTTRREPLDFSDSDAEISYFLALENNKPSGKLVQRSFGITYLPEALLVDGTKQGERKDYWGYVGRTAARFPLGDGLERLQLAAEVGFAPETPEEAAIDTGLAGTSTDDTDGLAWNVSASWMDFYPDHSIGFQYARTEAGWLLSPNYINNSNQMELRYSWRPEGNVILDARIRHRKEIERISGSAQKAEEWQFFLRATVRYSLDNLNIFNIFE